MAVLGARQGVGHHRVLLAQLVGGSVGAEEGLVVRLHQGDRLRTLEADGERVAPAS